MTVPFSLVRVWTGPAGRSRRIARHGTCILALSDRQGRNSMAEYDLVIRNTTIATASDVVKGDIGIVGGRVVALGERLDKGRKEIDATGLIAVPGGIDAHVHFDQDTADGSVFCDDFESGSRAAAAGGTTTIIPFAYQSTRPVAARRGQPLSQARRGQVADRLCLPRDPVRSQREDHGPGFPGAGGRRLHLVQGLHDLRRREAHRPRDARCAGGLAARAGDADDPCREFRLHRLADRAARDRRA